MYEFFLIGVMLFVLNVFDFDEGVKILLLFIYVYDGEINDIEVFLREIDISVVLVFKDGEVVFEEYYLIGGCDVIWLFMFVVKSFVFVLVGVVVVDGYIKSIVDFVMEYVFVFIGFVYDGVFIKDILQMLFGVCWNEDYSDFNLDINCFGCIFVIGGFLNEFVVMLICEFELGIFN